MSKKRGAGNLRGKKTGRLEPPDSSARAEVIEVTPVRA